MSNGSNLDISIIAERYATAMIELGEKHNLMDSFNSNLMSVKQLFESHKDLNMFLTHPTIPIADKKEVIEKIFINNISEYVLNLLKLLLDRNRIFLIPSISNNYEQILNKKRNIQSATIITAIEINQDIQQKIKDKLEKLLNSKIQINTEVDSDIIAGMLIKIGDKVIDGSIRTNLNNMKKQII